MLKTAKRTGEAPAKRRGALLLRFVANTAGAAPGRRGGGGSRIDRQPVRRPAARRSALWYGSGASTETVGLLYIRKKVQNRK